MDISHLVNILNTYPLIICVRASLEYVSRNRNVEFYSTFMLTSMPFICFLSKYYIQIVKNSVGIIEYSIKIVVPISAFSHACPWESPLSTVLKVYSDIYPIIYNIHMLSS